MNKKVVAGAIIGGVVICGIAGYSTAVNQLESRANDAIQETVNKSSDFMTFTYKDLDVNVFNSSVMITDAVFTPAVDLELPLAVKIKTIEVSNIQNQEFQPKLCYEMTGVEFPMNTLYAEDEDFRLLKYGESVSGNISGCYDFNLRAETLTLTDYQIDFDGFYKMRTSIAFEDVDFGLTQTELDTLTDDELYSRIQQRIEADPFTMLASLAEIKLTSAEYDAVDRGFLDRFIDASVAESGINEQLTREKLIRNLVMIGGNFGNTDFGLQLLGRVADYFRGDATTMTITASPTPPMALSEIDNLHDLNAASHRLRLQLMK